MKRFTLVVALGVAVFTIPLMLAKASSDANDDGRVDLADYAIMQQEFTGPGYTREIRSFYAFTDNGSITIIPEVPGENGFIITDFICRVDTAMPVIVRLCEEVNDVAEVKLRVRMEAYQTELHFNAGIPVKSGSAVTVMGSCLQDVTISGYTY